MANPESLLFDFNAPDSTRSVAYNTPGVDEFFMVTLMNILHKENRCQGHASYHTPNQLSVMPHVHKGVLHFVILSCVRGPDGGVRQQTDHTIATLINEEGVVQVRLEGREDILFEADGQMSSVVGALDVAYRADAKSLYTRPVRDIDG